ncbi:MAG: hypothetical protein ABIJ00_08315 [Candidatus Eisenbacteria bacterium]
MRYSLAVTITVAGCEDRRGTELPGSTSSQETKSQTGKTGLEGSGLDLMSRRQGAIVDSLLECIQFDLENDDLSRTEADFDDSVFASLGKICLKYLGRNESMCLSLGELLTKPVVSMSGCENIDYFAYLLCFQWALKDVAISNPFEARVKTLATSHLKGELPYSSLERETEFIDGFERKIERLEPSDRISRPAALMSSVIGARFRDNLLDSLTATMEEEVVKQHEELTQLRAELRELERERVISDGLR